MNARRDRSATLRRPFAAAGMARVAVIWGMLPGEMMQKRLWNNSQDSFRSGPTLIEIGFARPPT